MPRPQPPKPYDQLTPEEVSTYHDQVEAWARQGRSEVKELLELQSRSRDLLVKIMEVDEEAELNGLTPELYEQALRLREELNARKEYLEGRYLLLPPGTGFTGDRLVGFNVIVIDKPTAISESDFPKAQSFVVTRK